LDFLALLRELSVPSQVMLTLTRDNMDQILALAERLRGLTGCMTFNRLSQTGEGRQLALPDPESFAAFLRDYVQEAGTNPVLGFKDNLLNLVLQEKQNRIFGGCTGFGCGAAFNFVALLPDGEVHACRKFPSMIGSISQQSLADIYESEMARIYRAGPAACRDCSIRPVCGGCQAVISSSGLDVRNDKDPFCFRPCPD
jgi:selenobiotic family peptide radical SAM maturase